MAAMQSAVLFNPHCLTNVIGNAIKVTALGRIKSCFSPERSEICFHHAVAVANSSLDDAGEASRDAPQGGSQTLNQSAVRAMDILCV
jgi:hypothetical protein